MPIPVPTVLMLIPTSTFTKERFYLLLMLPPSGKFSLQMFLELFYIVMSYLYIFCCYLYCIVILIVRDNGLTNEKYGELSFW